MRFNLQSYHWKLSGCLLGLSFAVGMNACSGATEVGGGAGGAAPSTSGGASSGGVTARGGASGLGGSTSIGGAVSGGAPTAGAGPGGSSSGGAPSSGGTNSAGASSGGAPSGSAGLGGSSAAGNAGAATGGVSTGGASTGGSAGGSSTGFSSDDFESGEVGKQPAGWDNFIAWNVNGQNPSGTTLALVDSTRAHSGTKSVHFHGGGNPAILTKKLPSGTNKLYLRAWVWMSRKLGQNPGANHETLLGIGVNKDNEVRFGEIKGVIGTNEIPTDDISPKMDQWGKGPVVEASKWACMEVAFLADKTQHELHAWADGVLVHEITSPDQWQNRTLTKPDWLSGKFVHALVGWHSFSSQEIDVWMDDIVLSTSPVGCK